MHTTGSPTDYGEERFVTIGILDGRMVVTVWTDRGDSRRIISMRKANEREQARYQSRLG
ncbi:BrnT family toxin [Bosea sp. (in: a-proteobacteria)]|uniref:BrnT family toxin n=1 Tax=Bosea sp. (in: a-proteobacteria) TaxID=1871050 RepID=UPI0035650367